MTRYYRDESNPNDGYYDIRERKGKFRWVWQDIARTYGAVDA